MSMDLPYLWVPWKQDRAATFIGRIMIDGKVLKSVCVVDEL